MEHTSTHSIAKKFTHALARILQVMEDLYLICYCRLASGSIGYSQCTVRDYFRCRDGRSKTRPVFSFCGQGGAVFKFMRSEDIFCGIPARPHARINTEHVLQGCSLLWRVRQCSRRQSQYGPSSTAISKNWRNGPIHLTYRTWWCRVQMTTTANWHIFKMGKHKFYSVIYNLENRSRSLKPAWMCQNLIEAIIMQSFKTSCRITEIV